MPQSLAQIWIHLVFSTKMRKAYLQNEQLREEMFRLMAFHIEDFGCFPKQMGGWIDHVHSLFGLNRTTTIAKVVEHVKTETSKWAKQKPSCTPYFSWQSGYGAFSVSHSELDSVIAYIQNQKSHHATKSFQDEYRELCKLHAIAIDERYVWD